MMSSNIGEENNNYVSALLAKQSIGSTVRSKIYHQK